MNKAALVVTLGRIAGRAEPPPIDDGAARAVELAAWEERVRLHLPQVRWVATRQMALKVPSMV